MAVSFQIEGQLSLDSHSTCKDLLFSCIHKPHKNTFVLVGKFLKNLEYLRPDPRCAKKVCEVTKGRGTILKGNFGFGVPLCENHSFKCNQ